MDPGTVAVIAFCVVLVLWYVAGHLYNRRRGYALFRWLEVSLGVLGGRREAGWLGSPATGARINIVHARSPFRRLEITILLARREVPLLWLIDHLHGRRDRLTIKATLHSPLEGEVEVVAAKSGALRQLKRISSQGPSWTLERGAHRLVAAYRGTGAWRQLAGLRSWLESYGAHLRRFSWQKRDPHVQLQMNAGGLRVMSSETFLVDLQTAIGKAAHVDK